MKQFVNAVKVNGKILFMLYSFEGENNLISKLHAFYKETEKDYIVDLVASFDTKTIDYTYLKNKLNQEPSSTFGGILEVVRFEFEKPYSNLTKQLDEMLDVSKRMTQEEWGRMKLL